MSAFLTGSRVYGIPRDESDYDMVILLPWDDYKILCRETWDEEYALGGGTSDPVSLRIQHKPVDLIITGNVAFYEAWLWANRLLKKEKPVTRERAVEVIKGCLETAGLKFEPQEIVANEEQIESLVS